MSRIILFPGLGADPRLYGAQRVAVPGVETPAWIEPRLRETLGDYARRWADRLDLREPAVLGGVSMGGMVALEMARHVGPERARAVVLIGSCRHPSAANVLLRMSERVSRVVPDVVIGQGRRLGPVFLGRGGTIPAADRALLARMACELPVSFIRWAARAVVEWEGCGDPGVPVHHIHGDQDWVIALRRVRPTKVVPGGAHVLNMSHPREVNAFIADVAGGAAPAG